ncbi:beta-1,4-xylanase [Mycobacteroides abscessus subsp. abscessus]|uniref:cellulase family glycosylhydrolase n=1 Tax=Gordonia jacobaea TaxID=122202 RepID=UPI0009CAC7EE|nr:cellulase family glycosylhydrolase [Gordonia jacobaea]SKX56112.1 beta-1,4-xylanase [Mycobacteroides abscessus subsp. abscessus]
MSRVSLPRHLLVALAAVVAVVSSVSCGAVRTSNQTSGSEKVHVQAPPPTTPEMAFSGGGRLLWASDDELRRYVATVVDSGARMVRLDLSWPLLEPAEGVFNWAPLDRVVNALRSSGIDVLGIIDYTPAWASGHSDLVTYRPNTAAEYGDFAGTVASRYKGRIKAYEIWNEPNGTPYFRPGPDPEFYTSMLRAAHTAIKTEDSAALVIGGAVGLAPDTEVSMNARVFIDRMYRAGAGGHFDALSVHPYSYPNGLTANADNRDSLVSMLADIRAEMVERGDGGQKIWATEVGYPSGGPGGSESRQAGLITELAADWAQLPYGGPVFIHELVDRAVSDVDNGSTTDFGYTTVAAETSYGVVRSDFTPKLAFAKVKSLVAQDTISNPTVDRVRSAAAEAASMLGEARTPVYQTTSRRGIAQTVQRYASGRVICGSAGCYAVPAVLVDYVALLGYPPSGAFTGTTQDIDSPGGTRVFYKPRTGVHSLSGEMLKAWSPAVGYPIAEQQVIDGETIVQCENGSIVYRPGGKAVVRFS